MAGAVVGGSGSDGVGGAAFGAAAAGSAAFAVVPDPGVVVSVVLPPDGATVIEAIDGSSDSGTIAETGSRRLGRAAVRVDRCVAGDFAAGGGAACGSASVAPTRLAWSGSERAGACVECPLGQQVERERMRHERSDHDRDPAPTRRDRRRCGRLILHRRHDENVRSHRRGVGLKVGLAGHDADSWLCFTEMRRPCHTRINPE